MFQQFSSTRSSLCASNLRGQVGLTVRPTMFFFFLKSFPENKKDRGKGTQNEEGRKVKKGKKSRNVLDIFIFLP
jgi:hypothetical protein